MQRDEHEAGRAELGARPGKVACDCIYKSLHAYRRAGSPPTALMFVARQRITEGDVGAPMRRFANGAFNSVSTMPITFGAVVASSVILGTWTKSS